jgi:nucleoside-diphosphate-sugar epimerase
MNFLITGVTGFIGSRLAIALLEQGEGVRALGRCQTEWEQRRAEEIRQRGGQVHDISLDASEALAEQMRGIDVVIHLAAAQHEANVPDAYFRQVNVEGTRTLLQTAEAQQVKRFVHGSTIGVYAWRADKVCDENSPLEPDNIYGTTKLEAEAVVRSAKLPQVIVRISETYGPGDLRLLKLFKGAEKGLSLLLGAGSNRHHLIYIDDLIHGLLLAAQSEKAVGETLVLVGPAAVTSREMIEAVRREVGQKLPLLHLPLWPFMALAMLLQTLLRPLGIQPPLHRRRMDFFRKSFSFSGERAYALLGHQSKVELEAGLEATARWYREQGCLKSEEGQ